MSMAFQYADTSQLVPLGSVQNILTFLAEFFILDYDFNITDFIGMFILMSAFLIPVVYNMNKKTEKAA
jgi:uncharacterized membrane protein